MAIKVAIADDHSLVRQGLRRYLETAEGIEVVGEAADGVELLALLEETTPDLALVDIRMPEMDGLELCRRIREVSTVPILFLTALIGEEDKVKGLTLGGDDYITKPVGRDELLARIRAALRRCRMPPMEVPAAMYSDSNLIVDFARHEVFRDGQRVELAPTAFRLLTLLVHNADRVVPVEEILEEVWGPGYESPDNVKWYVAHLRRKLGDDAANPRFIVNVRGVGYRYQRLVDAA
ncbi:MAG: response regulator transcription factor [Chloroflexota bacterium]